MVLNNQSVVNALEVNVPIHVTPRLEGVNVSGVDHSCAFRTGPPVMLITSRVSNHLKKPHRATRNDTLGMDIEQSSC
jgi:hypothetical protein